MASKLRKRIRAETRHKARQERKVRTAAANPPIREVGEGFLVRQNEMSGDMDLIKRAVVEDWPVTAEIMKTSVDRLHEIQGRESVSIPCGEGVFESVAVADANAIKAVTVLRSMVEANRKRSDPSKANQTTINVGVNISADERRQRLSAIATRCGIDFVPDGGDSREEGGDPTGVVRVIPDANGT